MTFTGQPCAAKIFRRLAYKYLRPGGKFLAKLKGEDIELNWTTVLRLLELSYRCTLCRRCAQACPIGVDNGLIAHEIRKLFSMELGIAPKEIHGQGFSSATGRRILDRDES